MDRTAPRPEPPRRRKGTGDMAPPLAGASIGRHQNGLDGMACGRQRARSSFSWRVFLTYNAIVVATLTVLIGLGGELREVLAKAAIFAIISLTISGLMETTVPLLDRFLRTRPPRVHLAVLNVLYLVGGALGFSAAFWMAHLLFGVRMSAERVLTVQGVAAAALLTAFIGNLVYTFERLRERVRESEAVVSRQAIERERLEKLRAEAELAALQARINPHFLFNTLNSLAALIPVDAAAAEAMTQRLSDCFRYVLHASHGRVLLSDEVAFVEDYLALEALRFGPRLRAEVSVDPALRELAVPGLLLQPLVENALKHGLGTVESGGTVRLDAFREGSALVVRVTDDGRGFAAGRERREARSGTGLENLRGRLRSAFGDAARLEVQPGTPRGTVATLRLPLDGGGRG
jgi:sensor histidine kinase YesM